MIPITRTVMPIIVKTRPLVMGLTQPFLNLFDGRINTYYYENINPLFIEGKHHFSRDEIRYHEGDRMAEKVLERNLYGI
jgi:hypothetical protein